jgi:DNA replication protein DnaC
MTTTTTTTPAGLPAAPPLPEDVHALLRRLRMPHTRAAAPEVLATARSQRWEPVEVLRALFTAEVAGRDRSSLATRRARAAFPTGKTFYAWKPEASSIPAPTQQALRTLEWLHRKENLVVCGPSGTGKTFLLEALGQLAVEHGLHVAWFTLEDLGGLIRRHRADDTVNKAITKILRADLIVVDLCRHRDYAEAEVVVGFSDGIAGPGCRHSYRLSRNASVLSAGRYRPRLAVVGVVRARARSLIVMSACR